VIKAKNIIKSFNDQIVLNNVSLTLPDKGLISIVCKSGCGKSTLLNVLSGLLKSDGVVIVDKINLSTLTDNELSSFRLNEIGFIYQDYKLFENESIEENVLLPFSTTFHVSKEETVYIGDSEVDVETAKNAEMDCIAVDWGFRDKDCLQEAGATVIVSTTKQVEAYIIK
jgi:ABC-type lipoprotein export system ATPase subunit